MELVDFIVQKMRQGHPHKNAIIETFFRYAIEALPAVNGRSHI